jgi:hypothetical protein
MSDSSNLQAVAEEMASKRADAALLTGANGQLSGILTDNDMTRRVVSQYLDPTSTSVQDVMTKNPKCVHMEDSALDALEMMVDNRFRHLPVLDKDGVVVGLLDIAKCLYDAISVLEKVQQSDESSGGGSSDGAAALAGAMASAMPNPNPSERCRDTKASQHRIRFFISLLVNSRRIAWTRSPSAAMRASRVNQP